MKTYRIGKRISDYLSKKVARRYLRNISKEHFKTKNQLAVFSFDFISQIITIDGRFEDEELNLIEKLLKSSLMDKVTIDLGANIGNHTLAFSKFSKEVFAFEPNPLVFDLLKINTKRIKNIQAFNIGASDRKKSLVAKIPNLNCGGGSLNLDKKNSKANQYYEVLFNLMPLDRVIPLSQKIGLIKIDIEGHELEALKGMRSLLEKNKPLIIFEQNRGIKNKTSAEVRFLKSLGYKFLYEFKKQENWLTPSYLPKFFESFFKFLEVVFFGEPSKEFVLNRIESLDNSSYDMLIYSFDDILKLKSN
jgi:FkbM family methyltransferase